MNTNLLAIGIGLGIVFTVIVVIATPLIIASV